MKPAVLKMPMLIHKFPSSIWLHLSVQLFKSSLLTVYQLPMEIWVVGLDDVARGRIKIIFSILIHIDIYQNIMLPV